MSKTCILIGAPVDSGAGQAGCIMGPDAFRTAGLARTLAGLGHSVEDRGNIHPDTVTLPDGALATTKAPAQAVGWTRALIRAARRAATEGFPIFLGGDHSLAAGSVTGVAEAAAEAGQPLFVLWLDAHTDIHTPLTTTSGNLHGTPVAYFAGLDGFAPHFPPVPAPVPLGQICMIGIRSVDPAENAVVSASDIDIHDMRSIDENGVVGPLRDFLARVEAAGGRLHVSLDVDFLDPGIAPGVGTTVPGGATFREAHLIMELLSESDLVTSLDMVELNPFLDERGRTATLMVDLAASLLGKKVLDRPTRRFMS
jgi:arginase